MIHSPTIFKILSFLQRKTTKIQAGEFRLSSKMSPSEILGQLNLGTFDIRLTIIEGWRREQISEKLIKSGLSRFDQKEFLEKTADLEGQLFPDTYLIPKEADAPKIIEILLKNYKKKSLSPSRETLILASLVEREIPHEEDRPIVAGILLKRLSAGWPLQVDATVQYIIAGRKCEGRSVKGEVCEWWPKNLTQKDLQVKSSYNTYLYKGLPPKPICNPGLSAIKATLNPTETEYWYYLSDKNGVTHFAKTIEEHNGNIQRYLLKGPLSK